MSNLIRDYNDKQQSQYASNLQMPKVTAPALQDAAPVADEQMQVTTPQAPPLEQMVAPDMGAMQQFVPQYDATAEFNNRLSRQLPTLLHGQPSDSERRASAFYDFIGTQIEENRKRSAAEAIVAPSLQQFNTPTKTRPNGFGSNVLKVLFGGDKQNASDDGVLGNEFDITKGRFGQYGNGVIGGAMYLLDNTLGLGVVRNTILDTGAGLASQAAGWAAKGGIIDTLFKTKDIGKAIQAGDNRYRQAMRNIYGDSNTSFLMQGLRGRDLGALGNLSGDSHDDYRKLYGSSPAAAGLDRAFFGRELTEQETKDYEKLTGYSVKEALSMAAGGQNPMFERTPEENKEYNDIMARVPEDFKMKMMLRNITGLVADIKTDDALKPLIGRKPPVPAAPVVEPEQLRLGGAPERRQLPGGGTASQRTLPPKERNTGATDTYMSEWLRRGETVETKPIGTAGSFRPGVNDPWVTIDATSVRVPEALPGTSTKGLLPSGVIPEQRVLTTPGILPEGDVVRNALPTEQFMKDLAQSGERQAAPMRSVADAIMTELRTSSAKSMVVSPSLEAVRTPTNLDLESVLRQQYMRRVEPGQFILQRLGTVADTDPVIAMKVAEPSPALENARRLALPPAKVPTELPKQTPAQAFTQSEVAKTEQFRAEDNAVQSEIASLIPREEVSATPRSTLPKSAENVAKPKTEETTKVEAPTQEPKPTTVEEQKPIEAAKAKLIPSSKEELLKQARERLNAEKAQRQVVETETAPKVEEPTTPKQSESVVSEAPKAVEGETPKQRILREAKERLDAQKAERRLEAAVSEGFAKPVEGNVEVRVDVETPKGQELLDDAIDFDTMFNKTYAIEDLDTMVSMVSRAAAGAPISFVGKVAPIAEVGRSQKEIYRFASLVPDPMKPGKPLLAPTKSMVADYRANYGVDHPYASSAIADSSMKYLTKNGGARRHKSLSDLAAEQVNPLYRKILSPTSSPIPLAVIEKFEKQMSEGMQALVKTSSDTVSVIDAAPTQVDTPSQAVVRTRGDAQKFIDANKLGIKKNLSADKLNEYLNLYETKGIDALPEEAFTKGVLSARKKAAPVTEAAPTKEAVKREEKVTKAAKKVVKTETLEDFEEATAKLEDLEPSLAELEAIEKKVSNLPIFDHRKKLAAPSHTKEVMQEVRKSPEVATQQEELVELTTQLDEVITQEQELYKTKQAVEVAIDNVDALEQAERSYFMKKYGMNREDATEFQNTLQQLKSREGSFIDISEPVKWQKSRKAIYKGTDQVSLNVDDLKIAPNYEQLRNESLAVGEYEKAAAWFYQNMETGKGTTNPVVRIDVDGNFEFVSGRGTFLAAMDSGAESVPVQLLSDARPRAVDMSSTAKTVEPGNPVEVIKELEELAPEVELVYNVSPNTEVPASSIKTTGLVDALKWTTTKQGATNPRDVASVLEDVDIFSTPVTLKQFDGGAAAGYEVPSVKASYERKGKSSTLRLSVFPLEALKKTYENPLVKTVVDSFKRGGHAEAVKAYMDYKTINPKTGKYKSFNTANVAADADYIPKEQLKDVVHEVGGILRLIPYLEEAQGAKSATVVESLKSTVAYKQEATAIESSIGKLSRDKQLSSEDIINASEEMLRYSETYGYLPPDSKAVKALEELRQNPRNHSKFMSFYGALKADFEETTKTKNATLSALRGWEAPITSRLNFTNGGMGSGSPELESLSTIEEVNRVVSDITGINFAMAGNFPEGLDVWKGEVGHMLRTNIIENFKEAFGIDSLMIMHGSGRTALGWNAFKGALEQNLGKKTYILSCQSSCPRTATAIPDGYILDTTMPDAVRVYSAISPDYGVSIPKDVIEEFKNFKPELSPKVEETFTTTEDVLDFFKDLPAATTLEDIKNIADAFGYRFTIDLTKEANFDGVADFQKWYERNLNDIKTKKLLSAKEVKPFENFMKTLDFEALNREIGDNLPELIRKVRENPNNTMRSEAALAGILVNGTRLKLGETINSTSQLKEVAVQNPELFKYVLRKAQRFVPSNKDLDLVLSLEETLGARPLKKGEVTLTREPLSRQNIADASEMAKRDLGYGDALNPNTPLAKLSRSGTPLKLLGTRTESLPKTVGEAATRFKQALMKVDETGVLDDQTQIDLNNSVRAMESLVDQSYAEKMRAVVRRLTGREANEGKPFMSAAVELLNDNSRQFSRDEVADILSYAIGTKDVKFAGNMDDSEVLRFGRMIAKAPETFSQFDHVYVGHGTGIVEHGNWSLEARPRTGYTKRELVQHVIDNNYPRGTEVGVAACETGCPKRIQDSVPPLHRVVSRGAVEGSLENLQRLIEGLSAMPTNPKVMDVLAEYDGLMREALNANKQRGTEILERMRQLEDDFNDITKRNKFANEQRTRAKIKQAQNAMEKEFLGDC